MTDNSRIQEFWTVTNVTTQTISIDSIPKLPKIKPKQTINLLNYATSSVLSGSVVLINYINKGFLVSSEYEHNHDEAYSDIEHNHDEAYSDIDHEHDDRYSNIEHGHDDRYSKLEHNHDEDYSNIEHEHDDRYSSIEHSHEGLDILTGGSESVADELHTHEKLSGTATITFSISSSVSWDSNKIPIWQVPTGRKIKLNRIVAVVLGSSTPQLSFNIEKRIASSFSSDGIDILDSDITATSSGVEAIVPDNIIDSNYYLFFTTNIGVESGTVDYLTVTIYFVNA